MDLESAVPELTEDYKIIDRLGTGTFSAVYKAIDLGYHTKWDNSEWHGHHPPASSAYYQTAPHPPGSKVFVAVKRIYVTSGPERIRNEISIMEDCRGCRHVSQLITAFRNQDQVVAIMPYHKNDDFRVRLIYIGIYARCLRIYAGLLQVSPFGRHQGVLPMYVSRFARHSCTRDHTSRCQACELSLRSSDWHRYTMRLRFGLCTCAEDFPVHPLPLC